MLISKIIQYMKKVIKYGGRSVIIPKFLRWFRQLLIKCSQKSDKESLENTLKE